MNLIFFFFSAWLSMALIANAQTRRTIVDELIRPDFSGGSIVINCDESINKLIGVPLSETNTSNETFIKIPGYRIQAFSGNQQQSRAEAETKAKGIKNSFPEVSTYVTYKAPVWRLLIGDFQTNEEANIFMRNLKKKLPALGREAYIVSDEIKVVF